MATDIYENRPQSFLTNIEPIANQMQNIALKLQNFLAQRRYYNYLDMLAELDDGKGGPKKETTLNMLEVKHSLQESVLIWELGIKESKAISVYLLVMEDIFQQCLMPGLLNII
jgi:hypothetical protein